MQALREDFDAMQNDPLWKKAAEEEAKKNAKELIASLQMYRHDFGNG